MRTQRKIFAAAFLLGALFFWAKEALCEEEPLSESSLRPNIEYKPEDSKDCFRNYLEDYIKKDRAEEANVKSQQIVKEARVNPPSLTVEGIIWDSDLPQAIINNKVLKAGDTISDAQIVNIEKNGVNIMFKNKLFKLNSPSYSPAGNSAENQEGGGNEK